MERNKDPEDKKRCSREEPHQFHPNDQIYINQQLTSTEFLRKYKHQVNSMIQPTEDERIHELVQTFLLFT